MNMPVNLSNNSPTQTKVNIGRWDMPFYTGAVAIGARCTVVMKVAAHDKPRVRQVYISFGQYDEVKKADSYGVPEDSIFHHCFAGEAELQSLMVGNELDFVVNKYRLIYPEDQGGGNTQNEFNYEMEVTDHRAISGQLYVDFAHASDNMDEMMATTFEVNVLPGTDTATQCMRLLFDDDNVAISVFKKGDSYIIRPQTGVSIRSIILDDGTLGYEVK